MMRALWESLRWEVRVAIHYVATMVLFAVLMTACVWCISHVLPMPDDPRPDVSIEHAGEIGLTREELDGRLSDGR